MHTRGNMPGLKRRGFLTASAAAVAGLGAARIAQPGTAAAGTASAGASQGGGLTDAVLAALRTHRLVGLAEETSHELQEHHDVLQTLLADPRLPGVVDDIVVEFGNAFYQDLVDRFILGGEPVADHDLRAVWRNTIHSPLETWDAPVYEEFFRRVRAVNWPLPPTKRIRVLLGDPPFDWSTVTSSSQIPSGQQSTYPASLVQEQVLAKGRRALLCYGAPHLLHFSVPSPSIVSLIQQQTGVRTYTIADLVPLQGDPGGLGARLGGYPRGAVIRAAGTWLGQFDGASALSAKSGSSSPFCGIRLGEVLDAGLYLGQPADLTHSWPNPAIYLDPVYWTELQRRNLIVGGGSDITDLNPYRQEQPPGYPPLTAAACQGAETP